MRLTPEFLELLSQFNAYDVEYVIVGGYALAYHGHPRTTKDIDIFVGSAAKNVQKLAMALQEFGFLSGEVSVQDLQDPRLVIRFGAPPNMVDLLKTIDGVDFVEVYNEALHVKVQDVPVRIISRANLIKNKRALGRYQDLADLEALGEIPGRER